MSKSPNEADVGDIFLVDYPESGGRKIEPRPAVVVSCAAHNRTAMDVAMMQISKQVRHSSRAGAVLIPEWSEIGLDHESVIKPLFISFPLKYLGDYIGTLGPQTRAHLKRAIAEIFGGKLMPSSSSSSPVPPSGPTPVTPQGSS